MTRSIRHSHSASSARGRLWWAVLIWLALSAGVILAVSLALTPPTGGAIPPPADVLLRPATGIHQAGSLPGSDSQLQQSVSTDLVPAVIAALPDPAAASQPPAVSTPLSAAGALLDVPRHPQERNLNCELRSATDLAAFYGWELTWEELFAVVGHDPGGDPNVGFVGHSMNDPVGGIYPAGYGVHVDPVARGLRRLGIAATAHHGVDGAWLRAQIDAGRPVIVWATYGMLPQAIVHWETTDGEKVAGVRFEHTFTVVGYDEKGVWVNDPWDALQQHYTWAALERSWQLLGNMALTIDER